MIEEEEMMYVGHRYMVIMHAQGWKLHRVMVATYMGKGMGDVEQFSLRPLAGTQSVPRHQIVRVEETMAPIQVPKIWRA